MTDLRTKGECDIRLNLPEELGIDREVILADVEVAGVAELVEHLVVLLLQISLEAKRKHLIREVKAPID